MDFTNFLAISDDLCIYINSGLGPRPEMRVLQKRDSYTWDTPEIPESPGRYKYKLKYRDKDKEKTVITEMSLQDEVQWWTTWSLVCEP